MGLEGLIGRERNVLIVCGFGGEMYRKAVIYQRKGLHHREWFPSQSIMQDSCVEFHRHSILNDTQIAEPGIFIQRQLHCYSLSN